jgi:hypothetical protein
LVFSQSEITMKGVVLFTVLLGTISVASARPDLNAFLNRKASSTEQLVSQVRSDRSVMDRYCRHYAMTPKEVVAHLKTLHVSTLKQDDIFVIYSVPEGGALRNHVQTLKKGTLVFVDESGKPELVLKCGNPLTRGPKNYDLVNEPEMRISTESEVAFSEPEIDPLAVAQIEEPAAPSMEPVIEVVPPEVPTVDKGKSDIPIAVGSSSFPMGLLTTPLLFLESGGGKAVPDPAGIATLGIGCAMLWTYRKRRPNRK